MTSVDGARPTCKPCDTVGKVKCDPCVHSGLVKEASAYCQQCEEHMCVECASMHTGFEISRNHSIIRGSDLLLTEETGSVKKLSLSYCAEHGDKAIEWFCEEDDTMFCDTCKNIKHRKCQVTSVSDKTAFGHAQALVDVINSMVSLNRRIAKFKSERQKSAKDLEDVAYSCELAVKQFTSTFIEMVERLERKLLSDINKVVASETSIIQDHVYTCNSLIPQLKDALTTTDKPNAADNDVTSVIAAHKLAKSLNTLEPTVSGMEREVCNVQIKFKPSGKLIDMVSGIDELGILEIDGTERVSVDPSETASDGVPPVSVRTWSDMEVVSSTVIKVPSGVITGSAVMSDGRLILADNSHQQIILLVQDFSIKSTLALPGWPWDVAVYGDNVAVVTMPDMKQLQYIHVDTTLRAGRTIPIGLWCWGVAVQCGYIYVGVNDRQYGPHVQVMDTCGNVTRLIGVDVHGTGRRSIYPDYITVGTRGTVYISYSMCGHIACYTNDWDVVYNVQHKGMSSPRGMLVDEEDNLLVCCRKSNTIHVLGKDGAYHRVILSSADGVVCPRSVSYRRSDQTLIITMQNTPNCRAYKLK